MPVIIGRTGAPWFMGKRTIRHRFVQTSPSRNETLRVVQPCDAYLTDEFVNVYFVVIVWSLALIAMKIG
jgi:hypothetical protein